MTHRRGHTLIELSVASVLIGICLLGVWALVRSGSRYLMATNAKTTLQRDAILCISRITREFQETNDGSFTVGNTANSSVHKGVLFASPRNPDTGEVDYDDRGRLFWPKLVCFYLAQEAGIPCVVRTATKIPNPTSYPPPVVSVDAYLAVPQPIKVIARNVTKFECEKQAASLDITMRCDLPSGFGRRYGFEIQTEVFTKN